MNAHASLLRRLSAPFCGLALIASSAIADTTLHRVPSLRDEGGSSNSATLAFVKLSDAPVQSRALYVSSGDDLKSAKNVVDGRVTTAFTFSSNDTTPTAVIDLGEVRRVHRISAMYSPRKGTMMFYLVNALPATAANADVADLPATLKLDADNWSQMAEVATAKNDGTLPGSTVDFAAQAGRYVVLRWQPASQQESGFTLAEVAAFGGDEEKPVAKKQRRRYSDVADSKDVVDTKDVADSKDIPEEGPGNPAPPAEGPPPGLPQPPPFTFIPQIVPLSQ